MTKEDLRAELERLKVENEALKQGKRQNERARVSSLSSTAAISTTRENA